MASYNPILDLDGHPFKIVKYATDTTAQVLARKGNERVRTMMDAVATGAEELSTSVNEISTAMSKSRDTAMTAVSDVEAADAHAQRLSNAAISMHSISSLSIALPARLLFWRSMRLSNRPGLAKPARVSLWWPQRSKTSPIKLARQQTRSAEKS
jgi:hypothetical protein